jgi:hypothetical protein
MGISRRMTHEPPSHLLDDMRNDPDPSLGDSQNVFSCSNRHMRILVADWVLNGPGPELDMRGALELYEGSGRGSLLDSPGRLTVASIYAEVLSLLEMRGEGHGKEEES